MEKLTGVIERVTFFNEDNGYSVLKIAPDKKPLKANADGTVTVVGVLPELVMGEAVEFEGQWVEDKQYGRQFRAESVMMTIPTSRTGLISYLQGLALGVGPVAAEKVVNAFGEDTVDVLDNDPERLETVLKPSLARSLAKSWADARAERETMIFLQGFGISSRTARRIFGHYGNTAVAQIQADPYALAADVFGIGFVKADEIAQKMGLANDAKVRVRAGLQFALNTMANDGHTFAPREILMQTAGELLKVEQKLPLELALNFQLKQNELFKDDLKLAEENVEAVYLPLYYHSERGAAKRLHMIANTPSPIIKGGRNRNWPKLLENLAKQGQIHLTDQQQGAVQAALTNKISVLTGGPGTGKTTTLRMVISALEELDYKFLLASPTGRASKRLSESTGRPASTIHRLLGFNPEGGFEHNEDEPLKADMVIIDETSMVDLLLFYQLLRALPPACHLMLVGDIHQLPSVGAGNVLRDVIESGVAHVTRLETIFRQDQTSQIVLNAFRINHGDQPFLDNTSSDFFFFKEEDPEAAAELIVDIVKNRLPERFDVDPLRQVQVIAPMYRGAAGVDSLNILLQQALNGSSHKAQRQIFGRTYRAGDKVMQIKNNYEKEVFNGDIGYLRGFDTEDDTIEVVMEDGLRVQYDAATEADQLRHAFCISTHRSQGSEYPVVVIPVLSQHYVMLQRNLLYTAITRAKKAVVLVGSRRAVAMAVSNNKVSERYSGLTPRLQRDTSNIEEEEPF